MPAVQLEPWRTSNETYFRMAELGLIDADERVELLDGVITPMSPKGVSHEDVKAWLVRLVIESVSASYQLRIEAPLPIGEGWVPEPDFALARRRPPGAPHPGHADWVCEVADTSLRRDREVKRVAFARYGVPEFWLIDVNAPSIEVFRHPAGEDFGHRSVHRTGRLVSSAVEGLAVDLDQLWRETLA